MEKNTSGLVVYSFPGEENFYKLSGNIVEVSDYKADHSEGFIFAPFDNKDLPIIKILGKAEVVTEGMNLLSNSDLFTLKDFPEETEYDSYETTIKEVVKKIRTGYIDKLVFSISEVEAHSIDDFEELLKKLRFHYPNAFVYYFYSSWTGLWIGASPELLLHSDGEKMETVALAGTLKNASKWENWGAKEIAEHRFVERFIETQLSPGIYVKKGPLPVKAGPVYHLSSHYRWSIDQFNGSPFDIHPGPALSGYPVNESIQLIKQMERRPRKYYSGFLGPVNGSNVFQFFINLRCMEVYQNKSVLYAGGGITEDSDPAKEWAELQYKFSTLRSKMLKAEEV